MIRGGANPGVWTIPAERMTSGREHGVPLTDRTEGAVSEIALESKAQPS